MQRRKTSSHGCSSAQKAVPTSECSTTKGNLEREQEVEDTMLDPRQPFTHGIEERFASPSTPTPWGHLKREVVWEQSLDDQFPSVVTDAGGETLAKDIKSKEGIIGSQEETALCPTHYPRDPKCEVLWEGKKQHEPRRGIKPNKRVDGIEPSAKFGDLITADQTILNKTRWRRKHSNRARQFHELDSESIDEDKRNIGNNVACSQRFLLPSQNPEKNSDNSK